MHVHVSPEMTILLQGVLIIGISLLLQMVPIVRRNLPSVVVLILTGIVFGPSVLGHFAPTVYAQLFPAEILKGMVWTNTLAVSLFGLMVGLHFNPKHMSGSGGFPITSTSTVMIPMVLCSAAAWWLAGSHPELIGPQASHLTFILALAICGSVTALPVLAAILMHMEMGRTKIGQRAVAYATVNDLLLWVLIAVVFAINGTAGGYSKVWWTLGLSSVFLAVMMLVVRPFLDYALTHRWFRNGRNRQLAFILCVAWGAGYMTELIGIHFLLGCFLTGAIVPKRRHVEGIAEPINFAYGFEKKIKLIIMEALVPFFFVSTGLKTDLQLQHISPALIACFGIMTIATTVGKFFGTLLPVKMFGGSWREGSVLGVFMNTKGLMEVVVLNIMLSSGMISSTTFSGMILMTLVTTAATMPLAKFIIGAHAELLVPDDHPTHVAYDASAQTA
jgi:Kef-type K+ transport system membrane component KefB